MQLLILQRVRDRSLIMTWGGRQIRGGGTEIFGVPQVATTAPLVKRPPHYEDHFWAAPAQKAPTLGGVFATKGTTYFPGTG